MSIVNPALDDYLVEHSSPADPVLRDLAEETARAFPDQLTMQISHDEGELLTMLTQLTGARLAVEVGTFTGYSSICIARGLAADGRLLACDVSEEWTAVARRYWERAGLTDRIDLRLAPAADTLRRLPAEPHVDFAFVDADKTGYPVYYEELVTRLRPGGLMVLDNVLQEGRVVDEAEQGPSVRAVREVNDRIVADKRVSCVMLPLRDGVTLVRRN
ncbi:O-methyltransferase [Streptomyces alkaliterrae]|uniref:SAM-dependent methyltransferase n=1 Tax=Streptomyces alkaliterrae TaxID=2213162 RepID=A0A5P0YT47_9ACTN|nr:class I SAM-dependent methyltransferase [Streptomyces alkaliterrae]MBB1255936.1 class I SAM-dependent methyltransferase [Streptomyces alkaliterrae]MBB1259829.1 class I SAM-dependent methyltransferase [Streptomyces alkaliterrae]MQS03493.1 SAM-dependent methyltransferase [Streptomyces alkaliterrae]